MPTSAVPSGDAPSITNHSKSRHVWPASERAVTGSDAAALKVEVTIVNRGARPVGIGTSVAVASVMAYSPLDGQGIFHGVRVFDGFRFDRRCRISADNEILLRELLAGRGAKLELMVARFEAGGVSAQPANRLRMVCESIYINWKLGIFRCRPLYQIAVLALNAMIHLARRLHLVRQMPSANP